MRRRFPQICASYMEGGSRRVKAAWRAQVEEVYTRTLTLTLTLTLILTLTHTLTRWRRCCTYLPYISP